jgi:crotonobetainyl-CoA:carnitine CoA-transferase CaiB-like acyl-CoA transferase
LVVANAPGGLEGVRVVDITQEVAGPLAARLLAEMGADVVHIEPPRGDNGRNSTTRYLGTEGLFHQVCNRSKRSLAVDISSDAGATVLRKLIASSDVLIDGTAPGTLERLGFGYPELAATNPRLIYGALTGYGRKGPLGDKRGYDVLVQAYCGVLAPPTGGGPRRLLGYLYADTSTPLLLVNGVLAALFARERSGRGQYVETSLLQGAVHMLGPALLSVDDDPDMQAWVTAAAKAQQSGNGDGDERRKAGDPTTQIFEAGDGRPFMLAAWTDSQFQTLCEIVGLPEIASDPTYSTRLKRAEQGENLRDIIGACLLTKPADKWVELFGAAGIPCGAVNLSPLSLLAEDHLWENDMLVRVDHPTKGGTTQPGVGILFETTPMRVKSPSPLLGEHTREILAELGYAQVESDRLLDQGVITATAMSATSATQPSA